MTQKEFIKVLEFVGYSYEIEGDKLVVTHEWGVDLDALTSLPPGVMFSNEGSVWLNDLKSLPSGVVFKNGGDVWLNSLTGDWFARWKGNIEGIAPNRLLNSMISKEMFI
jgi:hypothetical protein